MAMVLEMPNRRTKRLKINTNRQSVYSIFASFSFAPFHDPRGLDNDTTLFSSHINICLSFFTVIGVESRFRLVPLSLNFCNY
jgi:hypothetical protein